MVTIKIASMSASGARKLKQAIENGSHDPILVQLSAESIQRGNYELTISADANEKVKTARKFGRGVRIYVDPDVNQDLVGAGFFDSVLKVGKKVASSVYKHRDSIGKNLATQNYGGLLNNAVDAVQGKGKKKGSGLQPPRRRGAGKGKKTMFKCPPL